MCGRTNRPASGWWSRLYGHNPPYPGKVVHQYTDGAGHGGGFPEGAPPFGRCDMNSADGLAADEFGRACGITIADSVPSEVAL